MTQQTQTSGNIAPAFAPILSPFAEGPEWYERDIGTVTDRRCRGAFWSSRRGGFAARHHVLSRRGALFGAVRFHTDCWVRTPLNARRSATSTEWQHCPYDGRHAAH
jgi:hypothetical protein